jgi:hypothetical protein
LFSLAVLGGVKGRGRKGETLMRNLISTAFAVTLLAGPAFAAAAPGDGPSLKTCAAKWKSFSPSDKDAYKSKAEGKTSKSGRKLSAYNVFASECMRK